MHIRRGEMAVASTVLVSLAVIDTRITALTIQGHRGKAVVMSEKRCCSIVTSMCFSSCGCDRNHITSDSKGGLIGRGVVVWTHEVAIVLLPVFVSFALDVTGITSLLLAIKVSVGKVWLCQEMRY